MQYIVSIENIPMFHWQIELLIESFKMFGLEDELVIAVAENKAGTIKKFTKNIISHKNKFQHLNYGKSKGYAKINKIYGLVTALKNGLIKQPFTLIHPDMIFINPVVERPDVNIVYHPFNSEEDEINRLIRESVVLKTKSNQWNVFGETMVFNNIDNEFFVEVLARYENLLNKINDNEWDIEKAAWTLTSFHHEKLNIKPEFLECNLMHDRLFGNFIHYKYGIPPFFNKKQFKFDSTFSMSPVDPYEVFLKNNPTYVSNYMQSVIKSYMSPETFKATVKKQDVVLS